eukprot:UN0545
MVRVRCTAAATVWATKILAAGALNMGTKTWRTGTPVQPHALLQTAAINLTRTPASGRRPPKNKDELQWGQWSHVIATDTQHPPKPRAECSLPLPSPVINIARHLPWKPFQTQDSPTHGRFTCHRQRRVFE